jgi:HEAT repeat protein
VRASALRALAAHGALSKPDAAHLLADPSPLVRRTLAEAGAASEVVALRELLADDDATVVEMAAWAAGEREQVADELLDRLIELTTGHADALVREASVAALGALGDERGLDAVLAATTDKATVRRRAVLALSAFEDPRVEAALAQSLTDRDWQVRQAAEDLLDP